MIESFVYCQDGTFEKNFPEELLITVVRDDKNVTWIDLNKPTPRELELLSKHLKIHPLIIEDCLSATTRTKIDTFPDYLFIVTYALYGTKSGELAAHKVAMVFADHYLITVHDDPLPNLEEVQARCEKNIQIMAQGTDFVLHALLDGMVDAYAPLLETIEDEIDEIEDKVLAGASTRQLTRLFDLRKQLFRIRKTAHPQREILNLLSGRVFAQVKTHHEIYFRDIYDHIIHVTDGIEVLRENITNLMELHMSVVSNRTNEVMKTLSIVATVMMPLTVLTGIYGMNFRYFPEIEWEYGYLFFWLQLAAIIGTMVAFFKYRKWI